ncbi:amidohydrolase [Pseudomaricurvus alkylphenolicus]|jgi:imidazolonepropionase-like amidohydrolase|uniref:amidohydrolase n=1 Tax=Pseudomaricurvus alkylphenolicus TaxID=1306991 RepID=UPI001422DE7E|nr:amidohydrolase [Pseudomaricurvus alkylphenolicus]NIB42708.1 amidohydrolase [Pseudomaricurvus alkylphenolicus]
MTLKGLSLIPLAALLLSACSQPVKPPAEPDDAVEARKPYGSTYQVPSSPVTLIRGATVLTGDGRQLNRTDVLLSNGRIEAVGANIPLPEGARVVPGNGKWLTPGLIDVHSHMGVYPAPETINHADGNEMTSPVTAEVWAEHSVWPQDPQYEKALAGGVTTFQVLPGSANLFGGRGVTLKNVASVTVQGMKFPDAPHSLKMACGENPKRVYGEKGTMPSTRMGNMAGFRKAWIDAVEYREKWRAYEKKKNGKPPKRDLKLETLMGVLDGEIRIHNHCYRADEMAQMIDLSKEFSYTIAAFHHAVEAYKVAPLLAQENICAVMWADWWGFKQEAFDMVRENLALVDYAKACAVIHSDDGIQVQRLNQEVAKAMSAGRRMGLDITRAHAIRWVTLNAAKSLGLDDRIGSITAGKNADLVLWSSDPFSIYSKADKVWIDGVLRFDSGKPGLTPTRDFNLGVLNPEEDRP